MEDLPEALKKKIRYQASSPDESALVAAAKHFGFFFHSRCVLLPILSCSSFSLSSLFILHRDQNSVIVNIMGRDERFDILNVLEFTSTRKRMSVVVRYLRRLFLLCTNNLHSFFLCQKEKTNIKEGKKKDLT